MGRLSIKACLIQTALIGAVCHSQEGPSSKQPSPSTTANRRFTPAKKTAKSNRIGSNGAEWFNSSIDELCDRVQLSPLRMKPAGAGDLEIRVWYGFGNTTPAFGGVVIGRTRQRWSAARLVAPRTDLGEEVAPPCRVSVYVQGSWDGWWKRLFAAGITILPDEDDLCAADGIGCASNDGTCHIVEVSQDGQYREYHYCDPEYRNWPEARQLVKIIDLLGELHGDHCPAANWEEIRRKHGFRTIDEQLKDAEQERLKERGTW